MIQRRARDYLARSTPRAEREWTHRHTQQRRSVAARYEHGEGPQCTFDPRHTMQPQRAPVRG